MEQKTSCTPVGWRAVDLAAATPDAPADIACSIGQALRAMAGCAGPESAEIRAALSGGSGAAGGFLLPDELSREIITRTSQQQVCVQAGARVIQLDSDSLAYSRMVAAPEPAWRLENGAVAEADPTFERETLTPRSLTMLLKVSRELLEDAYDIENVLADALTGATATEIDRVAIEGTGTAPQPRGILNVPSVAAFSPTATQLTGWWPMVYEVMRLRGRFFPVEPNAMMTSATLASWLECMPGMAAMLGEHGRLSTPPSLQKLKHFVSYGMQRKTAPLDEETALIGDFRQLLFGWRGGIQVELLRERYAENHQIAFLVHARMDVALRRPDAFVAVGRFTKPNYLV
jgi:predicted phage gp36 major capsid-like protein